MPQLKEICSIKGIGEDIDPMIVFYLLHHAYDGDEEKMTNTLSEIIGKIVIKDMITDTNAFYWQLFHNAWNGDGKTTELVFGPSPLNEAVKTITMIDEMKKYML